MSTDRRRKGRVEVGLDHGLAVESRDLSPSIRAGLRALAHGCDLAEAAGDPTVIATAGRAYFEALKTARLTPEDVRPVDTVDAFLAGLGRPGAGANDTPNH